MGSEMCIRDSCAPAWGKASQQKRQVNLILSSDKRSPRWGSRDGYPRQSAGSKGHRESVVWTGLSVGTRETVLELTQWVERMRWQQNPTEIWLTGYLAYWQGPLTEDPGLSVVRELLCIKQESPTPGPWADSGLWPVKIWAAQQEMNDGLTSEASSAAPRHITA